MGFMDWVVSGGPGGIGGAGQEHAPISKGVVDVPDLGLPLELLKNLLDNIMRIGEFADAAIDSTFGAAAKGFSSIFGFKSLDKQSGVEPGAPIRDPEMVAKIKRWESAAGGADLIENNGIVKIGSTYYRSYGRIIEIIFEALGQGLALLIGYGPIAQGAKGVIAAGGVRQFMLQFRQYGWKNIKAVWKRFRKGLRAAIRNPKVTTATTAKVLSKADLDKIADAAVNFSVATPKSNSDAGKILRKIGGGAGTKLKRFSQPLARKGLAYTAGLGVTFVGLKATIKEFIQQFENASKISEDDLNRLAEWYAFSVLCSAIGYTIANGFIDKPDAKTGKRKGGFWRKVAAFTVSELAQAVLYSALAEDISDTNIGAFIESIFGKHDSGSYRNRGGIVALSNTPMMRHGGLVAF